MPFWSRLFGSAPPSAPAATAQAEEYKGYRITPTPIPEGGQFRLAARIEKDGQRHDMVRADTTASAEEATASALAKARRMIDEQGDRLFG